MESKFLNINLNNYKIFYEVAKELNISSTARKLYMTQAAISTSIKNLEETLEVQLFIRKKKGVELTLNGKKLFKTLQKSFSDIENVGNEISEHKNSKTILKIGTTRGIADFFLPYIINQYLKIKQNSSIQIYISDSTDKMMKKLENGEIDIIFDNLPIPTTTYRVSSQIVGKFENCFVCNEKIFSKLKPDINIKDLLDYNLVLPTKSKKREGIDKLAKKYNKTLDYLVELPNSKLMVEIIKQNDCIGYVSEKTVLEELKNKTLFKINVNEEIEADKIVMIFIPSDINENIELLSKIIFNNNTVL